MPDERTYIKVHDGMPDHPKVDGLSDKAFRLLVESWCWCSRHHTDGRVPTATWVKRGTAKARAELVDAGLVHVHTGHVEMHDYLEHQRSAAQIAEIMEAKRRAGALGNHNRWHVPPGRYDPNCPMCISDPSHVRSQQRSQTASRSDRKTSPETESETDTPLVTLAGGVPKPDAREPTHPPKPNPHQEKRPPDRCPQHAKDPNPPPCRACGNARHTAEKWDAEQPRRDATRRSAEARRAAELRAIAAMQCDMCDDNGRLPGGLVCDHDPARPERAARGRAAIRAALTRKDTA